jgi:hypothetical protein
MKLLVGLVLAVVLAMPASAAAGEPVCDLGDSSPASEEEARVDDILGARGGADDIRAMLGDQAAGYWAGTRENLAMGIAPGPLSFDEARAAIEDLLTDRFGAADAALVMSQLGLYPMPYGDNEIYAIADELDERMVDEFGEEFVWVVDRGGCLDGEAWRVQVGLFSDATPDQIAAVRELIAPYGDIVRLYLDGLVDLPNAGGGTTAARLRSSFIRLRSPKRCVSTRTIQLKTRRSARSVIRRITVRVNGKRRALTDHRLAIRIKRGVTRVRVVVRVADGSRWAHTYRFRRCAQASSAVAGSGPCGLDDEVGSSVYQDALLDLIEEADIGAQAALGPQYANLWFSDRDQGWDVGVAPGPLTLDAARAAILDELAARFPPNPRALLADTLHVYAMPYGMAELEAVQSELSAELEAVDAGRGLGIGCEDGDAWRVEVELFSEDATAADIEQVKAILAPYGDRVRLIVVEGGLPESGGGHRGPRTFVKAPKAGRCIRGDAIRIKVRRAMRRFVKRVNVTVAGRRHRVGRTPLRITLTRRVTRVTITVRLRGGDRLRRTYTFRRC